MLWVWVWWLSCTKLHKKHLFKPGVCKFWLSTPGFLKLLWFVCWYVCVCVCLSVCLSVRLCIYVSTPEGINNQWRDMVWYRPCVQLFLAFSYFIWHFLSIKWMGVAILAQLVMNACQRRLRWHGTSYKRMTGKTERFICKSKWANA